MAGEDHGRAGASRGQLFDQDGGGEQAGKGRLGLAGRGQVKAEESRLAAFAHSFPGKAVGMVVPFQGRGRDFPLGKAAGGALKVQEFRGKTDQALLPERFVAATRIS
jgi:hypothetical protein